MTNISENSLIATASRDFIVIFINGKRHDIFGRKSLMMLADYLRYELGLCGTKIVCAEGDCGACTVLCYRTKQEFKPLLVPINACIAMLLELDGCHIVTVEGLKENNKLSAVQKSMVDHHASQCGFCTPGFVMAISAMFEKPIKLSEQKVKNSLTGNLCRCTGYQPIINSVLALDNISPVSARFVNQELDNELRKNTSKNIYIKDKEYETFAPINIADAVDWRLNNPDSCIIAGTTDVGVGINKGKFSKKSWLSLHLLEELYEISKKDNRILVGARVSFSDLRKFVKTQIPELASFLNIFASPQIKNMATLVGNIANGSPIGDSIPFMLIADGLIHVRSKNKLRDISIEDLYLSYKTLSLRPEEIITHVSFLIPKKTAKLKLIKVSQRKDLDISAINGAFLCEIENSLIKSAKIAFGGVEASVIRLKKLEKFLENQKISPKIIDDGALILQKEIAPLSDLRASEAYRRSLCENLFREFFGC
jgi:xanthine dehydrogenase small subunit